MKRKLKKSHNAFTSQSKKKRLKSSSRFSFTKIVIIVLGIILTLFLFREAFFFGTTDNSTEFATQNDISPTITPTPRPTRIPLEDLPDPTCSAAAGWKVYTSETEKVCFTYPNDWMITTPTVQSVIQTADDFAIQSPSGLVKVSWASVISGLGGGCLGNVALDDFKTPGACPLITVIEKLPIKNASGLYVVSGTITGDGAIYQPWMAVQDDNGLVTTTRSMGYDEFMGRNNGALKGLAGINADVIFSTGGIYARGSSLTQDEANAWFGNPEVQVAKQILLSLTY